MTDSVQMAELLRARGFDWAIKIYSPSNEAGDHYAGKLSATITFMKDRGIGESAPAFDGLFELRTSNPIKLDAFLEALVSLKSAEMITAAWRMIQGMQLASMDLKFESAKAFALQVSLKSPYGELTNWPSNHNVRLAVSTYQAGKLLLIGVKPDGRLGIFERTFNRCMGLWSDSQTIWMSTKYQVWRRRYSRHQYWHRRQANLY